MQRAQRIFIFAAAFLAVAPWHLAQAATTIGLDIDTDGTLTVNGDISFNDASADTITIGQNGGTPDTVVIAGNVSLSDTHWSITDAGVFTGASLDVSGTLQAGSGNITLTDATGNIQAGAYAAASIDGDDLASSLAGNGLALTAGSPDTLDLDLLSANDGSGAVASNSGLEFAGAGSDQLALLQGCADGEIIKWDDTAASWECAEDGGGSALPVDDTVSIAQGSDDDSKEFRFEVDGLSAATTRVLTVPDASGTIAVSASAPVTLSAAGDIACATCLTGSFTEGSVLFADADGLAEDNASFFWDDAANRLGIGTDSPGTALHLAIDDASTNSVSDALTIAHTTTGTAAAGIGAGVLLQSEDTAGNTDDLARISADFAVATSGAESSQIIFTLRSGGAALAETLRLRAGGILQNTSASGITIRSPNENGTSNAGRILTNDSSGTIVAYSGNSLSITSATTTISTRRQVFTQSAATSGTQNFLTFTAAAYTGQAASTELIDVDFDLDRTITFATGAIGTQRAFRIQAPTYAFAGASTITDAATLHVSAAPVAGTNATITNAYAVWIDDGAARFDGRLLGAKGSDAASANDLTLGSGNYFDVTGTTQVNGIATAGWTAGSMVTLQFEGSVTVKHNTAASAGFASLLLAGAADFSATADDTLTLMFDGTTWREVSRTVI